MAYYKRSRRKNGYAEQGGLWPIADICPSSTTFLKVCKISYVIFYAKCITILSSSKSWSNHLHDYSHKRRWISIMKSYGYSRSDGQLF